MLLFTRVLEPELMNDGVQVDAYASADFSESHNRLIARIGELFPGEDFDGTVLNLGCGSGDDAFRFAKAYPRSRQIAVDGASTMIERAKRDLKQQAGIEGRVEFLTAYIPSSQVPRQKYVASSAIACFIICIGPKNSGDVYPTLPPQRR